MLFSSWWRKLSRAVRRKSPLWARSPDGRTPPVTSPAVVTSGTRHSQEDEARLTPGLRQENERLRQRVRELEDERDRERQSLATLRAEYAAYRHSLAAWARGQFTEAELRRFTEEEDEVKCLPLDQFIGELDEIIKGRQHA